MVISGRIAWKGLFDGYVIPKRELAKEDGRVNLHFSPPHENEYLEVTLADNKLTGSGTLYSSKERIAELTFVDNEMTGAYKLYRDGSMIARGNLIDGCREGESFEYCNDVLLFKGNYKNNRREGMAEEYDTNGFPLYIGEYEKDVRVTTDYFVAYNEKKYKCHRIDSNRFLRGEFDSSTNHFHGYCIEVDYQNQPIELSYYRNDLKQCHLRFYNSTHMIEYNERGSVVYVGGYENNPVLWYPREGKGFEICHSIPVYSGEFHRNIREGFGQAFYYDGSLFYHGSWKNGQISGHGMLYHKNGTIIGEGEWSENGCKEADGSFTDLNQVIMNDEELCDIFGGSLSFHLHGKKLPSMKQLYCLEQIKFPQPLQCEEIEPIVCDKEEWSLNDVFTVNTGVDELFKVLTEMYYSDDSFEEAISDGLDDSDTSQADKDKVIEDKNTVDSLLTSKVDSSRLRMQFPSESISTSIEDKTEEDSLVTSKVDSSKLQHFPSESISTSIEDKNRMDSLLTSNVDPSTLQMQFPSNSISTSIDDKTEEDSLLTSKVDSSKLQHFPSESISTSIEDKAEEDSLVTSKVDSSKLQHFPSESISTSIEDKNRMDSLLTSKVDSSKLQHFPSESISTSIDDKNRMDSLLTSHVDPSTLQMHFPSNSIPIEVKDKNIKLPVEYVQNNSMPSILSRTTSSEYIFEGNITSSGLQGSGRILFKSGMVFREGGFHNGLLNCNNGVEYWNPEVLSFKNTNTPSNKGTIHYCGSWKEGKMEGKGMEYSKEGKLVYCGNFHLGVYEGFGQFYGNTDHVLMEGIFKNGQLNGNGKIIDDLGHVLCGNFVNNQLEGEGEIRTFPSNFLLQKGTFAANKLIKGSIFDPISHAIISKGSYVDGKLHGLCILYYTDGKKRCEGVFYHGNLRGKAAIYGPDGNLIFRGNMQSSGATGFCEFYDKDGLLEKKGEFQHGVGNGEVEIFSYGKRTWKGFMKEGKREGNGEEWDAEGRISFRGEYHEDQPFSGTAFGYMTKGNETLACLVTIRDYNASETVQIFAIDKTESLSFDSSWILIYEGHWKDRENSGDIMKSGNGVYYLPDGRVIQAVWENDSIPEGSVVTVFGPNPTNSCPKRRQSRFYGNVRFDTSLSFLHPVLSYHGSGRFIYEDESFFEGIWDSGNLVNFQSRIFWPEGVQKYEGSVRQFSLDDPQMIHEYLPTGKVRFFPRNMNVIIEGVFSAEYNCLQSPITIYDKMNHCLGMRNAQYSMEKDGYNVNYGLFYIVCHKDDVSLYRRELYFSKE